MRLSEKKKLSVFIFLLIGLSIFLGGVISNAFASFECVQKNLKRGDFNTQKMLKNAVYIPGMDVGIGLFNLGRDDDYPWAGDAAVTVIEGGVVTKSDTYYFDNPDGNLLGVGIDLELLDYYGYTTIPLKIDVDKGRIILEICRK